MKTYTLASIFAVCALASSAQAVTIATFNDPSPSGATPLFTATDSAVSASWSGTGLTLHVPVASLTFNDVQMEMLSVNRTEAGAVDLLGAGVVTFWTTDYNNPIFTMTFDGGVIIEPFASGSSTFSGNIIDFGGSALAGVDPLENEQFAFSFANPTGIGTDTRHYTSAMTSSADVVPEPATMTLLALGLGAFAARRKRA